jgi:hypothetical protein
MRLRSPGLSISSIRKTPEHTIPAYSSPVAAEGAAVGAAEAAPEAAEAAEVAEAAEAAEAAEVAEVGVFRLEVSASAVEAK